MTILPAKRTNSTSNENPEENNQNGQQMTLSLNIPQSRLNHNNPLLTQTHNQFSLHQESNDRQLWNCHEELSHSRTSHSSFEDTPSCSGYNLKQRRKYASVPVNKERYYRNERKRIREQQKQERTHRERELDQKLEKCERTELCNIQTTSNSANGDSTDVKQNEDGGSGYNSEDEYVEPPGTKLTEEEWRQRDLIFARSLEKRGFIIKPMVEDGACLFRAIADQVYGDQEMHSVVRTHCMDYIYKNRDFYCAYITEDFNKYVSRKRHDFVHGNHLEIQALSEMYHRTIEVYCYQLKPINIFHGVQRSDYEPIRLSYHRASHYNSITNPFNPSVGVGLGLPSYVLPADMDRRQLNDAVRQSEELLIEQTMMEDKLKATDWEATNEVIEEQVARESYLQWCKENDKRRKQQLQQAQCSTAASSSTITSGTLCGASSRSTGGTSPRSQGGQSPRSQGGASPRAHGGSSPRSHGGSSPRSQGGASPRAQGGASPRAQSSNNSPRPISSPRNARTPDPECSYASKVEQPQKEYSWETDSIFSRLPPEVFGLHDWEEASMMARVLATSQQEYLDSLKARNQAQHSPGPSTSR